MTGNWGVESKKLKYKCSQSTDADLKLETGKEGDLLKRVETRLNEKQEEVINVIRKGRLIKTEFLI
jgi:hypothetical protein